MRHLPRKRVQVQHSSLLSCDQKQRTREGKGIAILLRQDLAYTEIDDIQLTSTTDNEQLTVAIRIDSNRELYVSTVYCPRANPSVELIDGLCENRNQSILTGDFNSNHPELGNNQTNPSGTRLVTATQNNNPTMAHQHFLTGWGWRMSMTSFSSRNQSSLISGIFGWEMTMAQITSL